MVFDSKKSSNISLGGLLNYGLDYEDNALFGTVDKSSTSQDSYSSSTTNTDNHSIKYAYSGGNVSQVIITGSAGATGGVSPYTGSSLSDYVTPTASNSTTQAAEKTTEQADNTILYVGILAVGGLLVSEFFKTQRNAVSTTAGAGTGALESIVG